ncbi:protein translocase subunit SecF [Pseudorhodobacter sp.]|uniref:protein translocase subunit SecF n=1 Tax=Pseudorhodobacter sp. TaxID=1934400 RepID=UPI002AFFD247|nr:protein translocase subunit SecF [Pseudorhodobacter sp.]
MAWRLKLVPEKTNINFFRWQWLTFGGSMVMIVAALLATAFMGLNFGIDFQGGTTLRTESTTPVDVGAYRQALTALDVGDVSITEVFDPSFRANQHVAQIRIGAQDGYEAVTPETLDRVKVALVAIDAALKVVSVELVGPKVSSELIWTSVMAVLATSVGVLIYIWLRFEWQFALGGVLALVHDVIITVGLFAVFQWKFDLTIVAALLTILGYSINDTVVVFDRLRENLVKFKTMPLREVMNLSVNETLSRTVMTSGTTLMALGAMLIWGGDVIRGFSLAIFLGVIVGTYSSVYVAKNVVLFIGLDRSDKPKGGKGTPSEYANIEA